MKAHKHRVHESPHAISIALFDDESENKFCWWIGYKFYESSELRLVFVTADFCGIFRDVCKKCANVLVRIVENMEF